MRRRKKEVPKIERDMSAYKVVDFYRDLRTWKMREVTESFFDELSEKLVLWVQLDDAIHLSQFCLLQGFAESTLWNYAAKYPKVREALDIALEFIAARREVGAVYGKIGDRSVSGMEIGRYQGMHSRKYREHLQWRATLNQPAVPPAQQVVVIEKFPSPDEPILLEPTDE
jgi:hypothetical protein